MEDDFFKSFATICLQKTSNGRYLISLLHEFGSVVKSAGTWGCF